ncbi:MAG: C25 family cysteine peptidase, partial [Candidatus Helarchaeota archaeon]
MAEWFSFRAFKEKRKLRGAKEIGIPPQKQLQKDFKDEKGAYELKITYTPEGMWYKEIVAKIQQKDTKVYTLEMPESGVILEPGEPMLPIEGLFVALPSGAELLDIKVVDSESFEFPGELNIIPAPEPTLDGGFEYDWKEPEYKPKDQIYKKDEEYPKELFKVISTNFVGSVKVLHLMMYPLHYKPKSKKLIVYNQINLIIEYTPGLGIAELRGVAPEKPSEAKEIQPVAPIAQKILAEYKDQVLNLESIEDLRTLGDGGTRRIAIPINRGELCKTSNKGQYLIITSENLVQVLKPLAESKEQRGMTTKIVTDIEIYNEFKSENKENFKAIRDFILFAYDYWEEPPEYVLLVGEVGKIPTRQDPTFNCPSDWYYSNLIGDIGPDISLGRIAINDPKKLKRYINKILEYEKNNRGTWINRVLLTAYERDDYISCCDDIAEILKGVKKKGFRIIKRYGGESTKEEVIDELEKGCGIVNYRGHGSKWAWQSSNGLDVNDVRKLKNNGKFPIVFSICCLNNAIDVSGECFGEAFVEAANGAVAFLGASRPSYTQPNHHFDRFIFRAIVDKKLRVVGKIFNYATIQLY